MAATCSTASGRRRSTPSTSAPHGAACGVALSCIPPPSGRPARRIGNRTFSPLASLSCKRRCVRGAAMQDYEKLGVFYLGREYDVAGRAPSENLLLYDSRDLTTHAVCVGMTGSGKTG